MFEATNWIRDAAAVIFITGIPGRLNWKYSERGTRYLLLDAGHAAQNACLVVSALGLGCCPVVSFYDDAVHDMFELDGIAEVVLYSLILGIPETISSKTADTQGGE
jgi:SagB-type dehydrogenase family enzyme